MITVVKNIGIILAAGKGVRFNNETPKQYNEIVGKEVISYVIDAFRASKMTDKILVVLSPEEYEKGDVVRRYNLEGVCGGETRPQSFNRALMYIENHYPDCENVIFHDAARPFIVPETFDHYFEMLKKYDYICTCQKITDSLGCYKEEMPNRDDFFLLQTPEAYRYRLLLNSIDSNKERLQNYYASYSLPPNSRGYRCFDVRNNYKITYPEDLDFLEKWMLGNKISADQK